MDALAGASPAVAAPAAAREQLTTAPDALTTAPDALTAALDALTAAFHAGTPLARALARARVAALGDKTRALALAWAHEQVRLGLGEILRRAAAARVLRVSLPPDALAWLCLAACQALVDEPPQAVPDRIKLLGEWLTGGRG